MTIRRHWAAVIALACIGSGCGDSTSDGKVSRPANLGPPTEAQQQKMREMMGDPNVWKNLETVALGTPDARKKIDGIKERIKGMLAARAAAAAKG